MFTKNNNYFVPRFIYLGLGVILGLSVIFSSNQSNAKPVNHDNSSKHEKIEHINSKELVAREEQADPMKIPLECIANAVQEFKRVNDYKCVWIQVERVKGKLQPETQSQLQATTKPMRIHMKWMEPRGLKGQEVAYNPGKDPQKMRVKGAGFLGAVGFLTLDINDPKATSNNRHKVNEAGLANLLRELDDGWKEEARRKKTLVQVSRVTCLDRPCIRVELTHPENPDGYFFFFKNIVFFDIEKKLPIKIDSYSWPKEGEAPPLEESYGYKDLQLNSGIDPVQLEK